LGFSFLHEGRTYFLFGDTVGLHGGDSIAYSQDTNPEDCLDLTFVTGTDGRYLPPSGPGPKRLHQSLFHPEWNDHSSDVNLDYRC
jgi:hypothetical protein